MKWRRFFRTSVSSLALEDRSSNAGANSPERPLVIFRVHEARSDGFELSERLVPARLSFLSFISTTWDETLGIFGEAREEIASKELREFAPALCSS